ncbi:MAG: Fic family protein [archaeon]|nr:Fic family protein [archaeon]
MVYTEIKEINGKKYYYRVLSVRKNKKVGKKRIYLGVDLEKKKLEKSESLADEKLLSLNHILTKEELDILDKIKEEYRKEPKETLDNRYESFCSLFTHDSTAIEGNTLTLQETANLLFENRVPPSKSLREINETLNHKKAFDYILNYKGEITKALILKLHELVVKDTLKENLTSQIGTYRKVQVFIRGTNWLPPKPEEVPGEIGSLLGWYTRNKKILHPLVLSAYFHVAFETIHPFVDGNGRTGRLLLNFILHKNSLPMINIPNTKKLKYYECLEEAQVKSNLKPIIRFLFDLIKEQKLRF